jgi:hypothetical protein
MSTTPVPEDTVEAGDDGTAALVQLMLRVGTAKLSDPVDAAVMLWVPAAELPPTATV